MNGKTKVIRTLGAVLLSAVVFLSSQTPAAAKGKKSQKHVAPATTAHRGFRLLTWRQPYLRGGRRIVPLGTYDGKTRVSINLGGRSYQTIRRWIPARYETRIERVLVKPGHYEWRIERVCVEPGRYETRYVPAVTEIVYDSGGNAHTVVVRPGRVEKVWVPPKYEMRKVKVWVPPQYELREVRVLIPGHWVTETVSIPRRSGLSLSALFSF